MNFVVFTFDMWLNNISRSCDGARCSSVIQSVCSSLLNIYEFAPFVSDLFDDVIVNQYARFVSPVDSTNQQCSVVTAGDELGERLQDLWLNSLQNNRTVLNPSENTSSQSSLTLTLTH